MSGTAERLMDLLRLASERRALLRAKVRASIEILSGCYPREDSGKMSRHLPRPVRPRHLYWRSSTIDSPEYPLST
jgi:hypothetical protein